MLFHIDEDIYEDGHINLEKLDPIGRLAGNWYTSINDKYEIIRRIKPDD